MNILEAQNLYEELIHFSSNYKNKSDGTRLFYKGGKEIIMQVADGRIVFQGEVTGTLSKNMPKVFDKFLDLFNSPQAVGPKRRLSKVEFELKAGPMVFSKLLTVKDSNPLVTYWFRIFDNPDFEYVDLDSSNYIEVMSALVLQGVLTQTEVDHISS